MTLKRASIIQTVLLYKCGEQKATVGPDSPRRQRTTLSSMPEKTKSEAAVGSDSPKLDSCRLKN